MYLDQATAVDCVSQQSAPLHQTGSSFPFGKFLPVWEVAMWLFQTRTGRQKLPEKATTSRIGKNFLFGVVAQTAQSSDAYRRPIGVQYGTVLRCPIGRTGVYNTTLDTGKYIKP